MMEGKLFDSRVVPPSMEIRSSGRVLPCPAWRHTGGAAAGILLTLLWPCRDRISLRASFSPARRPNGSIVSFFQTDLFLRSNSLNVNGVNGASPSLSSRERVALDADEDIYEGVVVHPERLPSNPLVFASMLRSSLSHWKLMGKKGVWLKLPSERADLVPIAVKEGFEYHHAERGYVMMTYWIPEGPCMLPANASHQVGVGGFVLSEKNEVLVVQEKHCLPRFKGVWKLPTGFILESEDIYSGVVREVKEETGIDTEFVEIIAFRHAQRVAFGKSDLFFICMLKPHSTHILVDNLEVQAAKWMPLDEFIAQQIVQGDNMFQKIVDICVARLRRRYCGLTAHHVISEFDGKSSSLYYNVLEPQDFNCQ
ncbi:nudix hydrolase 8-like [Aristolochia californica]|uniref:nudix hydrolase 8-like n=1 Tax=Aristolochia californica TaxID=171875 RepID=UPI0035DECA47